MVDSPTSEVLVSKRTCSLKLQCLSHKHGFYRRASIKIFNLLKNSSSLIYNSARVSNLEPPFSLAVSCRHLEKECPKSDLLKTHPLAPSLEGRGTERHWSFSSKQIQGIMFTRSEGRSINREDEGSIATSLLSISSLVKHRDSSWLPLAADSSFNPLALAGLDPFQGFTQIQNDLRFRFWPEAGAGPKLELGSSQLPAKSFEEPLSDFPNQPKSYLGVEEIIFPIFYEVI